MIYSGRDLKCSSLELWKSYVRHLMSIHLLAPENAKFDQALLAVTACLTLNLQVILSKVEATLCHPEIYQSLCICLSIRV